MSEHYGYLAARVVEGKKLYLCFQDGGEVIDLDRLRMLKRASAIPCAEAALESPVRLEALTVEIQQDGSLVYEGGSARPRTFSLGVPPSFYEWRPRQ